MNATGINLSALAEGRQPLIATAHWDGRGARLDLRPVAALGNRVHLADRATEVFARWREELTAASPPIAVDVALDVSELTHPAGEELWRLTQRAFDFAFYGDSPLTDRIGEFGVRLRAMLSEAGPEIGRGLVEASARATVDLMGFRGQYRHGSVHYGAAGWRADDRNRRADKLMVKLLLELGINPGPGGDRLHSDDLDAALCALTALGSRLGRGVLSGDALDAEVLARCGRRGRADKVAAARAPASCVVLAEPYWESVTISRIEA
jgi:hypothetical protein